MTYIARHLKWALQFHSEIGIIDRHIHRRKLQTGENSNITDALSLVQAAGMTVKHGVQFALSDVSV